MIFLDVRYKTYSGPANAILNLVPDIVKGRETNYTLICNKSKVEIFGKLNCNLICTPNNSMIDLLWTQVLLPILILKSNCKLYVSFKYPVGPQFSRVKKIYFFHSILSSFRRDEYPLSISVKLYWRLLGSFFLKRAHKIIAVSDFVGDFLKEKLQIDENKVEVIHNGIDVSDMLVEDDKLNIPMPSAEKYVLCCGNILPVKNHETVVSALKYLPEKHKDLRLVIAGEKNTGHFPTVKSRVDDLGLESRVDFKGFISRAEMGQLYRQATVAVLPSLTEACSISAGEILAFGLPLVVSRRGGNEEVCSDAALYLEDPRDEFDLAEKIVEAIKLDRTVFESAAKERVEMFRWDRASEKCHSLFMDVIK